MIGRGPNTSCFAGSPRAPSIRSSLSSWPADIPVATRVDRHKAWICPADACAVLGPAERGWRLDPEIPDDPDHEQDAKGHTGRPLPAPTDRQGHDDDRHHRRDAEQEIP